MAYKQECGCKSCLMIWDWYVNTLQMQDRAAKALVSQRAQNVRRYYTAHGEITLISVVHLKN